MATTSTKPTNHRSAADVESAILDAARELLAAGGVSGLSMRQIADRVGVTATAIYHYFDGKQEIVNRVVLSAFERFGSYLKDAMSLHPKGSLERLHALGEAYIRFALENDAHFRVIFSIQPKRQMGTLEIPEGGGYNLLREAVLEAIDAGNLKDEETATKGLGCHCEFHADYADVVSMYLWSIAHGLVTLTLSGAYKRCESDGNVDVGGLLNAFAPIMDYGIRVSERKSGNNDVLEERGNCE